MPGSHPFAVWLSGFLGPDEAKLPPHRTHRPTRQRALIQERRWESAYPLKIALNKPATIAAIRGVKAGAELVHHTQWLFDPELRLILTAAVVEYLADHIPLMADDLSGDIRVGLAAARVALILYTMSAIHTPLQAIRRSPARLVAQLTDALKRDVANVTPGDLIAIHIMIRRLLALKSQRWALEALQTCLPFSPLTRLIDDSDTLTALAATEWSGIEVVLCSSGLDGLRIRCAQALIDSILPGWKWHEAGPTVINARFRRASELFGRLALALDSLDPVRAMRLAAWLLRTYKLMAQSLEMYQRVVLPPPFDPRVPAQTPSFRMLAKFLPTDIGVIRENYVGFVAPVGPVIALLLEASRLASTPIYVPDGLPESPRSTPYPESDALMAEAMRLIRMWKSMETTFAPVVSNLYQFVQSAATVQSSFEQLALPEVSATPATSLLDEFQFDQ